MNVIITKIILFNADGDKREVNFTDGLNIITGDSKTGKSSLIEIVDYCLFSSRSTIPKGIINNFTELFVLVLKISDKYLIIARPNTMTGEDNKSYLRVETNDNFLSNISIQYCKEVGQKSVKDIQTELERHLGIAVLDTRIDEDDDKRMNGKVTMRSFTSFLFQHQNLIANKHSIFYRFDDYYKRKKTIDDYPILIGWESYEYFLIRRELEEKKKQLKIEEKIVEKLKKNDDQLMTEIKDNIELYYNVIGLKLEDSLTLKELKSIGQNLPHMNIHSYANSNIQSEVDKNNELRHKYQSNLIEIESLLMQLNNNSQISKDYVNELNKFHSINDYKVISNEIICPLCKNHTTDITDAVKLVVDSKTRLIEELSKMGTYTNDNSGQIENLRKERNLLKSKIDKISTQIEILEEQEVESKNNRSLKEQSEILKGITEFKVKELITRNNFFTKSDDIDDLKNQIKILTTKLDGFDLKRKIEEAEVFLSNRMSEICNKLDFEEELKPGKLQFSINNFTFYYHHNNEKIYLSEMGSGANWLSCHLSLFIALLHLSCKSEKSSIPSILMLDQPSQVYFPREYGKLDDENKVKKDENIEQVKNIFRVIIEEIENIYKDCGIKPQIIVMEHADETEFNDYVKARWKKDGSKLI
jgi:hypothetical protein